MNERFIWKRTGADKFGQKKITLNEKGIISISVSAAKKRRM